MAPRFKSPEDIVASNLYERRRLFRAAEIAAASDVWSRLCRENTLLRVARDGVLVSAPLDHFDAFIIDQSAQDWEVVAKLIGRTMASLSFDIDPQGQSPSHILLFSRILALGDSRMLDVTGPGPGMRDYKVRKAKSCYLASSIR